MELGVPGFELGYHDFLLVVVGQHCADEYNLFLGVWGLGFGVWDVGCEVWGLGFRV